MFDVGLSPEEIRDMTSEAPLAEAESEIVDVLREKLNGAIPPIQGRSSHDWQALTGSAICLHPCPAGSQPAATRGLPSMVRQKHFFVFCAAHALLVAAHSVGTAFASARAPAPVEGRW